MNELPPIVQDAVRQEVQRQVRQLFIGGKA